MCTASLTCSSSTFCPHSVFMCFVWISEQTAIISLYSVNWLVCITETECVYCAVRTGNKNTLKTAQRRTMTQAIICRPLSTQTLFRSQASTCKFRGGQSDNPTGFSPSTWFFPVTLVLPIIHVHFHFILLLPEGRMGEA
jgi:hypothetical protein